MKHLVQIQAEFSKLSRAQESTIDWWENMSESEQREYLQNHPGSKMRLTPRKPGYMEHHMEQTPEKMELARRHVHDAVKKLMDHPGDAHAETYLNGNNDSQVDIRPGFNHFNRVYKKNNQLFERTPKHRGDEKDHPITPAEAASILRHHMGFNPIDPDREKIDEPLFKEPKRQMPKDYNPRPPENYDPGPGSLAYHD